jgi:hypothetical protein
MPVGSELKGVEVALPTKVLTAPVEVESPGLPELPSPLLFLQEYRNNMDKIR